MKIKDYFAITHSGSCFRISGKWFDEVFRLAYDKCEENGEQLLRVIEKSDLIDSPFLALVQNKFDLGAILQEVKGLDKYGQPVNPLDDYDWLNMAEEEQIDGYKYLVAERQKRDTVLLEVIQMLDEFEDGFNRHVVLEIKKKLRKLSKNI